MSDALLTAWTALTVQARVLLSDDAGEGVISTAIAVLVMAVIGVVMWQMFDASMDTAGTRVNDAIDSIGG